MPSPCCTRWTVGRRSGCPWCWRWRRRWRSWSCWSFGAARGPAPTLEGSPEPATISGEGGADEGAEPVVLQRSPPPTWGGIGWGVDEQRQNAAGHSLGGGGGGHGPS